MAGEKETRVFERLKTSLPVVFGLNDIVVNNKAVLEDFSAGGLRIKSFERLFVGDHIWLKVQFPGESDSFKTNGKVAWSQIRSDHTWDVGIRFSHPLFSKLSSVTNYCYN